MALQQLAPTASPLDDGRVEEMLDEMNALPEGDQRRERIRAEIVQLHSGLTRAIARHYGGRGEPLEDIEQAAMVGLVKAINRYDSSIGDRFLPYARLTVTGEVKRHFRDRTWRLRVPRRVQELRIALRQATAEFLTENSRHPTVAEISQRMDVPVEEIVDVLGADNAYSPHSLDTPLADQDGSTLADMLATHDDGLDTIVDMESLRPLLETLPKREQTIVLLRFWGNKTQQEIATELGISQMHVSRLLNRSLAYLRKEMLRDS